MKVIVTICSREKNSATELLPATERYVGEHIKLAQVEANRLNIPLYILSGEYGLIASDELIHEYDYLLEKESDGLTKLVAAQAREAGITEVDFYYKDKEAWVPYNKTLRMACGLAGIVLHFQRL